MSQKILSKREQKQKPICHSSPATGEDRKLCIIQVVVEIKLKFLCVIFRRSSMHNVQQRKAPSRQKNHLSWFGWLEKNVFSSRRNTKTFRASSRDKLTDYLYQMFGLGWIIKPNADSKRVFLVKVKNLRQATCDWNEQASKVKTANRFKSAFKNIFSALLFKYLPNVYQNIWNTNRYELLGTSKAGLGK